MLAWHVLMCSSKQQSARGQVAGRMHADAAQVWRLHACGGLPFDLHPYDVPRLPHCPPPPAGEKKAYTLLQQLNAIRNEKAQKRRDQSQRRRAEHGKKLAAQEAWRDK